MIRFEKTVCQEGIIVRQQTCATYLARTVSALSHCSCFFIILWLLLALNPTHTLQATHTVFESCHERVIYRFNVQKDFRTAAVFVSLHAVTTGGVENYFGI